MVFPRKFLFPAVWLSVLFVAISPASAQSSSRDQLLKALSVSRGQLAPVKNPDTGELSLPPMVSAPESNNANVEAAAQLAAKTGDPELITALLLYQFAYRGADNTVPAKALGYVFLEQSDAFLKAYKELDIVMQVKLITCLEFGYKAATRGKNKSIRKYQLTQKKLDKLSGSLMNAGR